MKKYYKIVSEGSKYGEIYILENKESFIELIKDSIKPLKGNIIVPEQEMSFN